ncbi:MAG: hypothetical protein RL748_2237 [Pseudomonadota bacterium]|jgi:hypothetical protein
MKPRYCCKGWLLGLVGLVSLMGAAAPLAHAAALRFGVLNQSSELGADLAALNNDNLAFIVVNGLKTSKEPCSNALYQQRKSALEASEHSVIVSLTANDWAYCPNPDALGQLRELLFDGELSLGSSKLPLTHLSANRKFRRYTENVRWELNGVLFATIHLPGNNNRYRMEAGRNGEFEDRLVANRLWLQRLFALAQQNKVRHLVLFSDGNLWQPHAKNRRDGFLEIRNQITQLSGKLRGKLLLIDQRPEQGADTIQWRGNVGHVSLSAGWHSFISKPGQTQPFVLEK